MKLFRKIRDNFRDLRFAKARKHNQNYDVSLISNCCIAGVVYKDFKMKFLSPTINLYFGVEGDFYKYASNLELYCKCELIDATGDSPFPIGKLIGNSHDLDDILIHFMHFSSFAVAKAKWIERTARINYANIMLMIEAADEKEHHLVDKYLSLPYPKVIFTDLASRLEPQVVKLKCYEKKNHKKASILSFIGWSGKRNLDEFDTAAFLNSWGQTIRKKN